MINLFAGECLPDDWPLFGIVLGGGHGDELSDILIESRSEEVEQAAISSLAQSGKQLALEL